MIQELIEKAKNKYLVSIYLYFLFFSHSIHILRATGVSGRSFLQPYMNP